MLRLLYKTHPVQVQLPPSLRPARDGLKLALLYNYPYLSDYPYTPDPHGRAAPLITTDVQPLENLTHHPGQDLNQNPRCNQTKTLTADRQTLRFRELHPHFGWAHVVARGRQI